MSNDNQGYAVHIGLNYVDPTRYGGTWDGKLKACEIDARDMAAITQRLNIEQKVLIREQATTEAVKAAISNAAETLKAGDFFCLTYAGHGGRVPNINDGED